MKVIDFGFARVLPEGPQVLTTPCYTLPYGAPEVISNNINGYTESCDLWSLGVILVGYSNHITMATTLQVGCHGNICTSLLKIIEMSVLFVMEVLFQYTLLSGHAPFHSQSIDDLVSQIQKGCVSFEGEEWRHISSQAMDIVAGLLTVNTSQRLSLDSLLKHPWLSPNCAPTTPLQIGARLGMAETAINHTLQAYHQVARVGVVLGDPSRAPLVKKRKRKADGLSPNPEVAEEIAVPKEDISRPNTLEIQIT